MGGYGQARDVGQRKASQASGVRGRGSCAYMHQGHSQVGTAPPPPKKDTNDAPDRCPLHLGACQLGNGVRQPCPVALHLVGPPAGSPAAAAARPSPPASRAGLAGQHAPPRPCAMVGSVRAAKPRSAPSPQHAPHNNTVAALAPVAIPASGPCRLPRSSGELNACEADCQADKPHGARAGRPAHKHATLLARGCGPLTHGLTCGTAQKGLTSPPAAPG